MKLGTKANTLQRIKPLLKHSEVPPFIVIDQLDVANKINNILDKIFNNFTNKEIIIRSSS